MITEQIYLEIYRNLSSLVIAIKFYTSFLNNLTKTLGSKLIFQVCFSVGQTHQQTMLQVKENLRHVFQGARFSSEQNVWHFVSFEDAFKKIL